MLEDASNEEVCVVITDYSTDTSRNESMGMLFSSSVPFRLRVRWSSAKQMNKRFQTSANINTGEYICGKTLTLGQQGPGLKLAW